MVGSEKKKGKNKRKQLGGLSKGQSTQGHFAAREHEQFYHAKKGLNKHCQWINPSPALPPVALHCAPHKPHKPHADLKPTRNEKERPAVGLGVRGVVTLSFSMKPRDDNHGSVFYALTAFRVVI